MTSKKTTLYVCDYCGKEHTSKHPCLAHEKTCAVNPINFRPCFECQHCIKRELEIRSDPPERKKVLFCNRLHKGVVPPRTQQSGSSKDLLNYPNEKMPTYCESFILKNPGQ